MAVSLTKGQKIDLTKGNKDLKKVIIGLGWETNKYDGSYDFDLDASAFLLNSRGKAASDNDFIFYNNLSGANGAITHSGDDTTGGGGGDDEQIVINLEMMPLNIEKISFCITIHDAEKRRQTFGQVSNAFVRLVDQDKDYELLRYDLGEDFSVETAIVAGELYRQGNEWKFAAVGSGYQGGLASLCHDFGLKTN
jgi:tellurium resistance protein TerD